MREPLENEYFNWLSAKVIRPDIVSYRGLLKILHEKEFIWVVPGDRHRASDGMDLREDFLMESGIEVDYHWRELPCSVLEFLIAFAKRANFQTDTPVSDLFWEFMSNLGLDRFQRVSNRDVVEIEDILDSFIYRTIGKHGHVTLFPLIIPEDEQDQTEVWYQFCEWVAEKNII